MDYINKEIDRDVDAQKTNAMNAGRQAEAAQTMYKMFLDRLGSERAADAATKAAAYQRADDHLAEITVGLKYPEQDAIAKQVHAKLQEEIYGSQIELQKAISDRVTINKSDNRTATSGKSTTVTAQANNGLPRDPTTSGFFAEQYVDPSTGKATNLYVRQPEQQAAYQDTVGNFETLEATLKRMAEIKTKHPGLVALKLKGLTEEVLREKGLDTTEVDEFMGLQSSVTGAISHLLGNGAVNKDDQERSNTATIGGIIGQQHYFKQLRDSWRKSHTTDKVPDAYIHQNDKKK